MQKHVVNDPSLLVVDSLRGLVKSDPALVLDADTKVVYLAQQDKFKVAIISGGGAGHEPAHAGWVTPGVLTGAITGNIFASPNVKQIRKGIELVNNSAGTLIVVKNYTGDVLHFGLAKEALAASTAVGSLGPSRFVIVGDDCAVPRSRAKLVGRRGLAGTTLVYKIAGALASRGAAIDEVEAAAKLVAERLGTVGVGLSHCHVPGTELSESILAANEVEIGMGIHNEPGFTRASPIPSRTELVAQMLDFITTTTDPERSFLQFRHDGSDEVALLVNNLGGLSELELGGVVLDASEWLDRQNIRTKQILSGTFMTSLNMPGFSITLLLLPRVGEDTLFTSEELAALLNEKDPGSKWRWGSERSTLSTLGEVSSAAQNLSSKAFGAVGLASITQTTQKKVTGPTDKVLLFDEILFSKTLQAGCEGVVAAESELTHYDTIAGDGDCGLTLKAGGEGIFKAIQAGQLNGRDAPSSLLLVAEIIEETMGGTSGALYSIFLNKLVSGLRELDSKTLDSKAWGHALDSALRGLYTYTLARPPSRTLVDPLDAFIHTFSTSRDFATAAKSAKEAAYATKQLKATAGRAAYVDQQELDAANVPDPGAWGIWKILQGMGSVLAPSAGL